jgi:hypothetical protein
MIFTASEQPQSLNDGSGWANVDGPLNGFVCVLAFSETRSPHSSPPYVSYLDSGAHSIDSQ